MDTSDFADACVDTDGVPAAEVAGLVRESCREWPGFSGTVRDPRAAPAGPDRGPGKGTSNAKSSRDAAGADGHILLLCGATGVGKSTIGFDLYRRGLNAGLTAGYIDLDQIGFLSPAPGGDPGNHGVKARNLAAMWQTYHAAGARHLIATGPVGDETVFQVYAEALPAAPITLCRIHAGRAELTRRIMSRGEGGSWPQPGDGTRC